MARLFNLEIFNQTISGDASTPPTYYSSQDHAALLGSADTLVAQIIMTSQKNTGSAVTVVYQHNNTLDGELWADTAATKTLAGPANYTGLPKQEWMGVSTITDRGAFGRVKVTSDKEGVSLRIIVTGYTNG